MKKIVLSLIIFITLFMLTGCTEDASSNDRIEINKQMVKQGIISSSYKEIDKQVETYGFPGGWERTYYIYENDKEDLIAIRYKKASSDEENNNKCDFEVYYFDSVYETPEVIEGEEDPNAEKYTINDNYDYYYCVNKIFNTYKIKKVYY